MGNIFKMVSEQKRRFPLTISWRLKKHCEIIEKHLNPGEEAIYTFCGQKGDSFFNTCVVAITNKRILVAQKYVFWGYYLSSITPDLYNDMQVYTNLLYGKVVIDTIKEEVSVYYIAKNALPEIETNVTECMMEAKKKYKSVDLEGTIKNN